jgi:hypothetical protein
MHVEYIKEGINIIVLPPEGLIPSSLNFTEGSFLYKTEDGNIESPIVEEYVFVDKQWKKINKPVTWSNTSW